MDHKVSVIIPVYNGEQFIARAIDSVLGQTAKPYELIVINDGSRDGTLEVLKRYEGRIRYVTIPNGGVSNARNTGIQMAQGDCIAFLDADDIWHPHKLQRQLEAFEKYPEAGFCCCDYSIYDPYHQRTINHFTVLNGMDVNFNEPLRALPVKVLLAVNFVGTCSTVMIRKKLLDEIGLFNVHYKQSEDFDLWLRLGIQTKFVVLSDVLVEKKAHGANLTNNLKESYACHQTVLADMKGPFKEYFERNRLDGDYAASVSKTHYKQGDLYFNANSIQEAYGHYWMALCTYVTPKNLLHFIYVVSRKTLRYLSGGLISRKSLQNALPVSKRKVNG